LLHFVIQSYRIDKYIILTVLYFHRLKKERKLVLPVSASIIDTSPDLMFLSGHQRKPIFTGWHRM
jgi:hypothetical protein